MSASLAPAFRLSLLALLLSGCLFVRREPPRPGSTDLGRSEIVLPARLVDNTLIVEAKWDHFGPYHFLIDTGSSVTLVTSELADRYAAKEVPNPEAPRVQVQSADGRTTVLPATVLRRIELGRARFIDVPALVYDCTPLTRKLGVRIDGVLGFPLFRKIELTLDYPHERVLLRPSQLARPPTEGFTLSFNNASKTPLIPVRIGDRTFIALVDSGSDETLSVNPVGLAPRFAFGPTEGPTVNTLTGERTEAVGRLAETVYLGDYAVPRPVVEVTDDLSALGGGILRYFTITFDQGHDKVTFFRSTAEPIAVPGLRGTGLSFHKTPAYWRVVGVIPGSPADGAEIEPGDLVTRINGEPVGRWDVRRFEKLMAGSGSATLTFLYGPREIDRKLKVVDIVP
jgi:hypothetical protein